jgi:hypothetical protein
MCWRRQRSRQAQGNQKLFHEPLSPIDVEAFRARTTRQRLRIFRTLISPRGMQRHAKK